MPIQQPCIITAAQRRLAALKKAYEKTCLCFAAEGLIAELGCDANYAREQAKRIIAHCPARDGFGLHIGED